MVIEIIIDTETTSLEPTIGQVISIGWAFKLDDEVKSGNILIRPNMERIDCQDKYDLNEALAINKITLEEIRQHPVEYHLALPLMLKEIKAQIRNHTKKVVNDFHFLAYNQEFDRKFISYMPHSHLVIPLMPHWISYLGRTVPACVMERAGPVWGNYNEYWGNYGWVRLVDAYSNLPSELKSQSELIAHNSESDSIMALLVHNYLKGLGDE